MWDESTKLRWTWVHCPRQQCANVNCLKWGHNWRLCPANRVLNLGQRRLGNISSPPPSPPAPVSSGIVPMQPTTVQTVRDHFHFDVANIGLPLPIVQKTFIHKDCTHTVTMYTKLSVKCIMLFLSVNPASDMVCVQFSESVEQYQFQRNHQGNSTSQVAALASGNTTPSEILEASTIAIDDAVMQEASTSGDANSMSLTPRLTYNSVVVQSNNNDVNRQPGTQQITIRMGSSSVRFRGTRSVVLPVIESIEY